MQATMLEILIIAFIIVSATLTINYIIHRIRARLAEKAYQLSLAHYGDAIYLDEDDNTAALPSRTVHRTKRSNHGGFLHSLPLRSSHSEKNLEHQELITELNHVLSTLRGQYGDFTYLGKHGSRGREHDTCLYARIRVNGITKCTGEIASLEHGNGDVYIRVTLHSDDARFVEEQGWAAPSASSPLTKMLSNIKGSKEVVIWAPRNKSELESVTMPVLHAAICWVGNAEQAV